MSFLVEFSYIEALQVKLFMVISDDIYALVKSLTKQERIYFKRFSGVQVRGEGNMYIRLFDAIAGMKEYDEAELVEKFKGEKFTGHMHVAKNYLYNAILRAMKVYRQPTGKKEEIHRMFEDVGILFDKRLYEQCRKILRRCRKLAEAYEKFPEMVEILIWESKINFAEDKVKRYEARIVNENYDSRKKYLRIMENMYEYDRLEYNFRTLTSFTKDRDDPEYKKRLREFISNAMLKSDEPALSTVAKLKYNAIKSNYFYEIGEFDESFAYEEKQVALLDSKPEIKSERFTDYLILMSNLLLLCVVLKKYNRFEKYVKKFRAQMDEKEVRRNKTFQAYIVERAYLMEMLYNNKMKNFARTVELYEMFNSEIDKLDVMIREGEMVNIKYTLCAGYFGLGEYSKSLDVLNENLNDKEAQARQVEYITARMIDLILHYELGNYDLLEYRVTSTMRYIKERKKLSKFEKMFFKLMSNLVKIKPEEKVSDVFDEFKYELGKLDEKDYRTGVFDRVDLFDWVNSKL